MSKCKECHRKQVYFEHDFYFTIFLQKENNIIWTHFLVFWVGKTF
jgi:hypothetical protein